MAAAGAGPPKEGLAGLATAGGKGGAAGGGERGQWRRCGPGGAARCEVPRYVPGAGPGRWGRRKRSGAGIAAVVRPPGPSSAGVKRAGTGPRERGGPGAALGMRGWREGGERRSR